MLTINFNPFPELNTPRFLLRAPVLSDAADILKLRSDPRVNQFLHRPLSATIEEAQQFLEKIQVNNSTYESLYWVIISKDTAQLVGTICFWHLVPAIDEAEIGYELQSEFFGQGIIQEVIPVVIRFGFDEMKLERITALPVEENERSVKLLVRQHFTLDDALRQRLEQEDDVTGILCYSLLREKS